MSLFRSSLSSARPSLNQVRESNFILLVDNSDEQEPTITNSAEGASITPGDDLRKSIAKKVLTGQSLQSAPTNLSETEIAASSTGSTEHVGRTTTVTTANDTDGAGDSGTESIDASSINSGDSNLGRRRTKLSTKGRWVTKKGYVKRQATKKKSKRTTLADNEEDTAIDILYQNERGMFFFGIPMFSKNSLLNFDPPPWQNKWLHTSQVDILTAQCPDPLWEWVWPSWYVDMGLDVDEEGWMYSFDFASKFSWHGNHVWFHSFVRRRRWLRKRQKRKVPAKLVAAPHNMAPEYFSIHSGAGRTISSGDITALLTSKEGAQAAAQRTFKADDEGSENEDGGKDWWRTQPIENIPDLKRVLHKLSVDRDKVLAIDNFLHNGGDELVYLPGEIPYLIGDFYFQSSKRKFLAHLSDVVEHERVVAEKQLDIEVSQALKRSDSSSPQPKNTVNSPLSPKSPPPLEMGKASTQRRLTALREALKAADEEIRQLEYFSDKKQMVQNGNAPLAPTSDKWNCYPGVDGSGPDPHGEKRTEETQKKIDKGKGKAAD